MNMLFVGLHFLHDSCDFLLPGLVDGRSAVGDRGKEAMCQLCLGGITKEGWDI